jgi:hypothetical protein
MSNSYNVKNLIIETKWSKPRGQHYMVENEWSKSYGRNQMAETYLVKTK